MRQGWRNDQHDLAINRSDASARERAIELKQSAPVRTFLAHAFGVRRPARWVRLASTRRAVKAVRQID